jgi:hypothetical protein
MNPDELLLSHVGHKISLVHYPAEYEYEGDPECVVFECDDCGVEVYRIDKLDDGSSVGKPGRIEGED